PRAPNGRTATRSSAARSHPTSTQETPQSAASARASPSAARSAARRTPNSNLARRRCQRTGART
uniref:Uncharacterized protein LOC113795371 n=1 Tax=Dermatophagoides pteronyssinus TaxID=6956 RepID=A0A6P6Y7S7_DERPT